MERWVHHQHRIFPAIGDDVNVTARLEAKTKDYNCRLVLSKVVAEIAGVDASAHPAHSAEVRGREGNVEIFAVEKSRRFSCSALMLGLLG